MRCLILAITTSAITSGAACAETVRIGTEGAFPPYSFINDSGEVDGFERELGDRLCEIVEVTCEWVVNDWDSIIPNLVAGNYDVILAGMTITEERDAIIDFTQAYLPPAPSSYVALSPDVDIETGVIAAQASTLQSSHVAETGAVLVEFATPEETIAAVRNGEVDAAFADKDYLVPYVDESAGELVFVGSDVPLGQGIGMGVRESDTELKARFDAALTGLKEDGTLDEMIAKWFGPTALLWK